MTHPSLPFSGLTPTSRHCSWLAAKSAAPLAGRKVIRYKQFLACHDNATDHEAAAFLEWPLSSICSIRNILVERGLVEPDGTGLSPFGKRVTRWRLR